MVQIELKKPKEADLCLRDINISRRHAEFSWSASDGWSITNYSDNGIWVNKIGLVKGTSTSLQSGDLVVLSDLRDLFGWHFHLRQSGVNKSNNLKRSEAADDDEENQPSKKRRKVGFVIKENSEQTREEPSVSRDLVQTLQKKKEAAEMKYAAIKQAVADAAKESKKKIESLVSERAMLLQRLEKKAREGEAREEEERLALEKEGGGEEERLKLEAKLLREREEASKEREKMLEAMEAKITEQKLKREEDLKEKDKQLEVVRAEKTAAESDRSRMEEELKRLKTQLEAKEADECSKEEKYQKFEEMKMRKEAELQEEKERLARQLAEQELREKETRRKEEEEREREREAHALELEALREEQSKREEEVKKRCQELEEKQALQASVEAKMTEELDKRKAEEEAFDTRAKEEKVAALEREKEEVAQQLQLARLQADRSESEREEGKKELLGKLADTLESQYQCPTCLDLFISPVALNCGHTYCWLCLARWRRSSSDLTRTTRGDLGSCPQCRVAVQHENRVYAIDQMIEALIAQLGAEKQEERAKAIAERKDEEADFLATATPKEKGRMRGGRGGVSALVRGGGRGRMEESEVFGPGGRGG